MTGTPSRTATASDGGMKRATLTRVCRSLSPRGDVGRKLQAKPWPEEHEPHMRRSAGGQGGVGIRSPMSSGPAGVDAAGMGRRSRALPREICPSVSDLARSCGPGAPLPNVQAHAGRTYRPANEFMCSATVTGTREAARKTDGRTEVSRGQMSHVQVAKGPNTQSGIGAEHSRHKGDAVHGRRCPGDPGGGRQNRRWPGLARQICPAYDENAKDERR